MRDLEKDLEICRAAPPGPWRWERPAETGLRRPKARLLAANGELICDFGVESVGSSVIRAGAEPYPAAQEFIVQAREGWPEAIQRAVKAEQKVQQAICALREIIDLVEQLDLREAVSVAEAALEELERKEARSDA